MNVLKPKTKQRGSTKVRFTPLDALCKTLDCQVLVTRLHI
ncbi:helix-turn-helix domain-containing protein [Priestia endophytica]